MSYYYKYNFTSPEIVYSTVKEELKSYFDTGAVDDLMFPTYLDKCLRKLGRATYVITEETLYIEDFEARLPDNFFAVREAWMCTYVSGYPYQSANSFYSQAVGQTTIQVSPVTVGGDVCGACNQAACVACSVCTQPSCNCTCPLEITQAVYKTNNQLNISYEKKYLLKPGNISVRADCALDCANFNSSAADSFDIRDNKFVTNFRNGVVHLVFYATEYDGGGNQLIPDNYRIREYIEAFIKYKVFETLTNQTNDETFNQLQSKLAYYKQLSEEAFIMADIEIKKQDVYAKQRRIVQDLNRFNMYELPNRVSRYGWRRNN
jgi:hypothetical protein